MGNLFMAEIKILVIKIKMYIPNQKLYLTIIDFLQAFVCLIILAVNKKRVNWITFSTPSVAWRLCFGKALPVTTDQWNIFREKMIGEVGKICAQK